VPVESRKKVLRRKAMPNVEKDVLDGISAGAAKAFERLEKVATALGKAADVPVFLPPLFKSDEPTQTTVSNLHSLKQGFEVLEKMADAAKAKIEAKEKEIEALKKSVADVTKEKDEAEKFAAEQIERFEKHLKGEIEPCAECEGTGKLAKADEKSEAKACEKCKASGWAAVEAV
jgi:hypothetical protein